MFRMTFSADSRWLYAAPEKEARLWDLSARKPGSNPLVFGGHVKVPTNAAVSPHGRWLVPADGKTARLWNLTADNPTAEPMLLGEQQANMRYVRFSAEDRWLITFTRGMNAPSLWDLTAAEPTVAPILLEGHDSEVNNQILLSPDRRGLYPLPELRG